MRNARMLALSGVAALGLMGASSAQAANVYTVDGGTSVTGGSKSKPKGADMWFKFSVDSDPAGALPAPVAKYSMNIEGGRANTAVMDKLPKCAASTMNAAKSDDVCKKGKAKGSEIGSGKMMATVGQPGAMLTDTANIVATCTIEFKVYNGGKNKAAFFVRAGAFNGCAANVSEAIPVTITKSGNYSKMKFAVPSHLLHILPGNDTGITSADVKIKKMSAKIKGKKKYMIEATGGCAGGKRHVQVEFTAEGQGTVKQEKVLSKC